MTNLLQVCQWLLAQGMDSYISLFMDKALSGGALLNLDSTGLKDLGIKNKDDREKIKKKIKELKAINDREKKDIEKEKNKREKLLKKAEKVISGGKGKKSQSQIFKLKNILKTGKNFVRKKTREKLG